MKKVSIFYDADNISMEGGGQKRLFEIARKIHLEMHDIEINWISFKFWKKGKFFCQDGITYNGFIKKPKFYKNNGQRNFYEPILYLINCFFCLPKYLKSDTFIIGQWPLLHIIPLVLIGLTFQKKVYIEWWETLQNQWKDKGFAGKLGLIVERLVLHTSSFVTFIVECESEKRLLLDFNSKAKVVVVENGVDISSYDNKDYEKIYDFVCLGRLVSQKNVESIIQAINIIKLSFKQEVTLCVIGDGPEKNNLKALIDQKRLKKNIHLQGFVKNELLKIKFLKESKIGIIAQDGVGKGNVVINELMAAGLPILAAGTKNGIDRSYIKEGLNGYFTESLDYNHLAEQMLKMLNNKKDLKEMSKYINENINELSWSYKLENYPVFKSN